MSADLLVIHNLSVRVVSGDATNLILDQVNLRIPRGRITGVVGGSGSGKSTMAMAILGLLSPALSVTSGQIIFDQFDLLTLTQEDIRPLRGKYIGMVFQEPLYAFNPLFTVGDQIAEVLATHLKLPKAIRNRRVGELLEMAGIREPYRVAQSYPHQLSGGMRQRAMIAQAIAGEPSLLIADEPTSNLDVTTQAKIMVLFEKLRKELDLTIMLISHDLGMVSHLAQTGIVMSAGRVVESGEIRQLMDQPQHEYTQQLVNIYR